MNITKSTFTDLFKREIHRDGSAELLAYLEGSDFFVAPASTRYHLSCDGGLCQHTINVYQTLCYLADYILPIIPGYSVSRETIAIVALLHDICKVGCYKTSTRNVKKNGKWESVPYYEFDDTLPYGHGEKSVYIINSFMRLTREEAFAIRYHMGFSDEHCDRRNVGKAFAEYPLSLLLHTADQLSTSLLEAKTEAS